MRHDDQAVHLFVAGIRQCEHRPVGIAFARRHLYAAHDAVGAGRRRHLDAVDFGLVTFHHGGEIDRGGVGTHIHRVHRLRGGGADQ